MNEVAHRTHEPGILEVLGAIVIISTFTLILLSGRLKWYGDKKI